MILIEEYRSVHHTHGGIQFITSYTGQYIALIEDYRQLQHTHKGVQVSTLHSWRSIEGQHITLKN
jgi:hypothetical protein